MKITEPIKTLNTFEKALWAVSAAGVVLSFLLSGGGDILTLIASLIGVTALIFVAKGHAAGQVLTVVFAVFYGIISFFFSYYGEMVTYLGMTAPIAAASAVSWLKHPYKDTAEVEVSRINGKKTAFIFVSAVIVTVMFYFILKALGNASLIFSTVSVTTTWTASCLTFFRSPFYGLAYAANDAVLIVLWVQASLTDASSLPMVICFIMFLLNDLYGFYNWNRMKNRQEH